MIFLDRSIPRSVSDALKAVRNDVAWLEDLFPPDTPDTIWLARAGDERWVVVSRDKRLRRRVAEIHAVREHNVGLFCLTQAGAWDRWSCLKLVVSTLDEMLALYESTPRPFIYTVDNRGTMTRLTAI